MQAGGARLPSPFHRSCLGAAQWDGGQCPGLQPGPVPRNHVHTQVPGAQAESLAGCRVGRVKSPGTAGPCGRSPLWSLSPCSPYQRPRWSQSCLWRGGQPAGLGFMPPGRAGGSREAETEGGTLRSGAPAPLGVGTGAPHGERPPPTWPALGRPTSREPPQEGVWAPWAPGPRAGRGSCADGETKAHGASSLGTERGPGQPPDPVATLFPPLQTAQWRSLNRSPGERTCREAGAGVWPARTAVRVHPCGPCAA